MKNIVRFLLSFLVIVVIGNEALAYTVTTPRTETTLLADVKAVHAGQKFWTVLHIKMQPGWHTYWKNAGDSGIPPSLTWTLPNGFSAGDVQFIAPSREKVGPLIDYAYSNDAYYLISITPPAILSDNTTAILALKANWLVCKDICIPESGNLSLALPAVSGNAPQPSDDAAMVASLVNRLPTPLQQPINFSVEKGEVHFTLNHPNIPYGSVKSAEFFPVTDGLIANAAEQQVHLTANAVAFAIKQAEGKLVDKAQGVISLYMQDGTRKDYDAALQSGAPAVVSKASPVSEAAITPNTGNIDILGALLFAFLGGLILNLMPCVFPILSLKALAVAKKSAAHPDEVRAQGMAYTAGVILSFLALALVLIALRSGGQAIGWGYQMQSPLFVASLAILMFVVGLNLSGYFELPLLFGSVGSDAASSHTASGSFVTGVLAVLVATPCTAPFMAPALGFALTGSVPVIVAVFISLGFGFALPFLLISLFPRLISALPRPGMWMLTFKQFVAFPMYLTVVWLLWVLTREAGADAGCVVLISMVIIAFAIWLWRDSLVMRFGAVVVAIVGLYITATLVHEMPAMHSAMMKRSEAFSVVRLAELRAQGKPVLVDATADWCITCKVNETVALSSPDVVQALEDKHIVYMVADWTHGDMDITHYLESFGRDGVPIYVYYPPKGEPAVLPQVLTPSIVLSAIQ